MNNCSVVWRVAVVAITGLLSLGSGSSAVASHSTEVAFYPVLGSNSQGALMVNRLDATRVRIVNTTGARLGTVVPDASLLIATLDSPLSELDFSGAVSDSCGLLPLTRKETTQIAIRDVRGDARHGTSQVIEFGTRTVIEGCDTGRTIPFGALTDAGMTMHRVAMDARPSMRDLLPGTQIAGFSEQEWLADSDVTLAADVATLYAGDSVLFSASGHVVPATFNTGRWLVLSFGTFERAYTRLAIDSATGAETWMRAEWSGNQAQRVMADLVVKSAASAGFGTERQASRIWESGLRSTSQEPFFLNLYQGGTGERISKNRDTGAESREPIAWVFAGSNIVQTRVNSVFRRDRTWVPLRNHGTKIRFVMESETWTFEDGTTGPFLLPRINFYIDRGKAEPATPLRP